MSDKNPKPFMVSSKSLFGIMPLVDKFFIFAIRIILSIKTSILKSQRPFL